MTASALDGVAQRLARLSSAQLNEVLSTLGNDDVRIIERAMAELTNAGFRSSPLAMAMALDPTIQPYGYARLLSDKFVDAVRGRSTRQIWNLPARYGKSLWASKYGPAWAFDDDPTLPVMLASYGDSLANENATFVRDLLVRHADVLACTLRPDRRRMDRFVTDQGGGLIAGGIGSALTGFGARGGVLDDPFKNWQDAHSEAMRKRVWDWYRSVFRLRLDTEDAWIIVVMTRWHEEDITGMLIDADKRGEGEQWEHVVLPAIAEADDLLGRKPGEPLEPLRFSLDAVLQRARALGSYLSAGLEQQRPAPEEGTDIMRGWWKWYDVAPPRFDDATTSWDMKLKDKETGDYVVGQAWGRTGSDFWLLDQVRGQWNQATTKVAIALVQVRHPRIRRHVVENTGYGPEVIEEIRRPQPGYTVSEEIRSALGITDDELPRVTACLQRGMTGILAENVKGDKRVRMRAQAPLIEAGNVHVPDNQVGHAVVDEASVFPNGAHDDMVDTLSQALKRLTLGRGTAVVPVGKVRTPAPGARSMRAPRSLPRR